MGLPFTINILDAKHLYSQGSLQDLGKSINLEKLSTIDFSKHSAKHYLETERETFFEYAVIDACIPVEAAINLFASTRKLALLSARDFLPPKSDPKFQNFLNKN